MVMRQLTVGGPMVDAIWDPNAGQWQEGSQNYSGGWVQNPNGPTAPAPTAAPLANPQATPNQNANSYVPPPNPSYSYTPTKGPSAASAPTPTAPSAVPAFDSNAFDMQLHQALAGKGSGKGPSGQQVSAPTTPFTPQTAIQPDFHSQLQNFINSGLLAGSQRLQG